MTAYYNEIEPYAAQWLRNLIQAGHIAPGIVDERSIEDVFPSDLRGFTQCHFFAGIGVWSYALRAAGWSDDRPVWTGSCPCQPFSEAGKGTGFDDERHLWPFWHHLIKECRPAVIFGEQVASKDAGPWIDLVQADVESLGYSFGAIPFPAAGVGAPHIRDRLYWVADSGSIRRIGRPHSGRPLRQGATERCEGHADTQRGRSARRLADSASAGPQGREQPGQRADAQRAAAERDGAAGGLAHGDSDGREPRREGSEAMGHGQATGADRGPGGMADHLMQQRPDGEPGICLVDDAGGRLESSAAATGLCGDLRPSPTNGFWANADWLLCRDGKWRPVEPGTFPLAHGTAARVGRLRGYGNAINAAAAQAFIEAVMDSIHPTPTTQGEQHG